MTLIHEIRYLKPDRPKNSNLMSKITISKHDLKSTKKMGRPKKLEKIPPSIISKNGFFVFSKKWPWGPLASKNCRITRILRICPRLSRYFPIFVWIITNYIQRKTVLGEVYTQNFPPKRTRGMNFALTVSRGIWFNINIIIEKWQFHIHFTILELTQVV